MIRIAGYADESQTPSTTLTLTFDQRQKSRLRVTLDTNEAAGLFLPRGTVIRGGDRLITDDGRTILVRAALEATSTVRNEECGLLARACYHLGNRHVPVEIGAGFIRYREDHVLDDMVSSLGLSVSREQVPFEPESGAYHSHGHSHEH